MLKIFFTTIILIHGLIHLMGFAKAFNLADIEALTLPIPKTAGLFWLITCLLMLATAAGYLLRMEGWWILAVIAIVVSQALILYLLA